MVSINSLSVTKTKKIGYYVIKILFTLDSFHSIDPDVAAFSPVQERLWLGRGVLTGIMGKKSETFAGEYLTEGQKTPVKLRSATTLRAISAFEARVDTKNNPVWYSFGRVVLALRYLLAKKE